MQFHRRIVSLALALSLLACQAALAQYPPGGSPAAGTTTPGMPGYTPPAKGYGVNKAALAAGIGAGVGAGVLFFTLRHRNQYQGCVGPDGRTFTRERDGKRFQLQGESLQPGQKLSLKAKKADAPGGAPALEVVEVRKDLGRCEQQAQIR